MLQNLLLEIGTEEIPARFMKSLLMQLKETAEKTLTKARIDFKEAKVYGTPRRLAVLVREVAENQKEKIEEVKGPSKKAAFNQEGRPTKAAEGFARSRGVSVEELVVRDTPGGEYIFALKREPGKPTFEVLQEMLPELILSLNSPKSMRWGYGDLRFVRPIHWVLALFGKKVIPFKVGEIESSRITYGHRFLSQGPIVLDSTDEYLDSLEKNYVIADPEKRKDLILRQIQELAVQESGQIELDEELLEEVNYLLEYPTALCGNFEKKYLEIPEEVLITSMREHQRYFPVRDFNGKLLPKFITVRNGTADHLDIVQAGNEKVLKARLTDAQFFFEEDLKVPLEHNLKKLEKVVFQESLGSISDKVHRIRNLSRYLAKCLSWEDERVTDLDRAALLAKADLVTNMVYEFPELQGIMGTEYARRGGEKLEVAQAIYEHYLPRFAGDILPATELGMIVSLADKLDTIIGCFAVGIQPTGSQDPYALRRQALGVCRIILDRNLELSLIDFIKKSYQQYQGQVSLKIMQEQVIEEVAEFFKQRLKNILSDRGISYDVQDAVFAVGFDNMLDLVQRAESIQSFRQRAEFDDLITAYNRAYNLARYTKSESIDASVFVESVEYHLFNELNRVQKEVETSLKQKDYINALESIATLRKPIAEFFDGVMVMVEESTIRNNRLALLKQVSNLTGRIADVSKIVVG